MESCQTTSSGLERETTNGRESTLQKISVFIKSYWILNSKLKKKNNWFSVFSTGSLILRLFWIGYHSNHIHYYVTPQPWILELLTSVALWISSDALLPPSIQTCTQGCVHTVALHQPTERKEPYIVLTCTTTPWRNLYSKDRRGERMGNSMETIWNPAGSWTQDLWISY